MKFVPFSLLAGAFLVAQAASYAQFSVQSSAQSGAPGSRVAPSTGALASRTTSRGATSQADEKSTPTHLANRGPLGSRSTITTSSYGPSYSPHYGAGYGANYSAGYGPYGYPAPAYYPPVYPGYPYPAPYAYPYGPGVTNNYYLPPQPYTIPIPTGASPYSRTPPPSITVFPLGPNAGYYAGPPAYPNYPAGYPAPYRNTYPNYPYPYPAYNGTYTYSTGAGNASIETRSQNSGFGLSVGRGGVRGNFGSNNSSSTTTVTRY